MARPIKMGLDYFPLDITLFSDRKFRKAKAKFGFMAVGVYLSLLKIVYSEQGYYVDYSDKYKDDILWEIHEDLSGKYQPTLEVIGEVIELLVASELFSVDHYKNKIITSKRIQETYYKAKKKSVCITMINPQIWMLTKQEMFALKKEDSFSGETPVKTETIQVISEETPVISEITPQSKGNESKVKKKESSLPLQSPLKVEEVPEDEEDLDTKKVKYFYELVIEAINDIESCYQEAITDIANYCRKIKNVSINGVTIAPWEYLQELYCACRKAEDNKDFFDNIFVKIGSQQNITNYRGYLMTTIYNNSKFEIPKR